MTAKNQKKRKTSLSRWKKWATILAPIALVVTLCKDAVTFFNQTATMVSTVSTQIASFSRTVENAENNNLTVKVTDAAGSTATADFSFPVTPPR
jgi:hypothetical protein